MCDAANDQAIYEAYSCTVSINNTLRQTAFNLAGRAFINAKVSAINKFGSSDISDLSDNAAVIPDALRGINLLILPQKTQTHT